MQDLFGSVRRSFAFRSNQDHDEINTATDISAVINNQLMEKINSCIRRSKIFSKPSSPSRPLSSPPIRYRKGELIGCGAFGQVYTGMNLDSGELLAIKQVLIAASGATREKAQTHIRELEEEVKLLKNLSHPNIVRYLGTVREEESLNILLEFVPGGSISSLLGKFGAFPEAVIRKYTKQLLLGLEYLHKNGIMHRDIKGANILVDNKGCIKLADFGASKQVVELATISGAKSMKGTPYWMAPEVILQTGHSFSADIWSVGCTVIEMATGKAPWSQQYQEVAALFHIGSTKSHPEIPDHLSAEAKDFLLMCLQKEPSMRPDASTLLQHPFLAGLDDRPDHNFLTQETESTGKESLHLQESTGDLLQADTTYTDTCQVPPLSVASDICNLGSLNYSIHPKKLSDDEDLCKGNNSDDDLCRIDDDEFSVVEGKLCPALASDDFTVGYDPIHDLSGDWKCELDKDQPGAKVADTDRVANEDNYPSHPVFEDDDELTESRIKAFLDEKAIELKKLHTPLFEEFYNSLNASSSPSVAEGLRDETSPNYLKLPPKSRSPSRVPFGSPSATSDAGSSVSPGSNSRLLSATGSASNQILDDNSSPNCPDQKGFIGDGQANSNSPSMSFSERQRKWKEELDQELERKREMMRQAGMGGKTSSPKDRGLCRQRERTRFASPGK